ncbi:MAG: hypothetical protein AMJ54_01930 [Deltaproteobacteria bacterium SG8_13]|nr:MAG: hypothetical protein AMJ54_01930 [Deltaproteobacteria bacterium SG8_13]
MRISSTTISIFFVLLALLFFCPSIQAKKQEPPPGEPVETAPQMVLGEQWVVKNHRGLRTHKVIEVKPDGKFVVEVKNEQGEILWHRNYDIGYHILGTDFIAPRDKSRTGAPWERALNFPLFVGKKWQNEIEGEGADNITRKFKNSWEVEKIETIDTPAGKYRAWKIHRSFTAPNLRGTREQYYWYAPDAKIVVKMVHDGNFRTKKGDPIHNDLIRYQPAAGSTKILFVDSKPAPEQKDAAGDVPVETRQAKQGEHSGKFAVAGTGWAVTIGISKYADTNIPQLRYAAADAQSFYNWLVSPQGGKYAPARVTLLIDADATASNIRKALFEWLSQAIEEDTVTIYFAGHGSPQSPDHPENLFLLPYDTQYDSVASSGFPMWDIETALRRFIKAKNVIVITDACHAGGVGQSFDIARRAGRGVSVVPMSSTLQTLSKNRDGICILSASDDNQFSREGAQWGGGHGVFTFHLLEGLKGKADYNADGRTTLGELIPFLSEQIRRETKNSQSPTVAGRFDPALSIGK